MPFLLSLLRINFCLLARLHIIGHLFSSSLFFIFIIFDGEFFNVKINIVLLVLRFYLLKLLLESPSSLPITRSKGITTKGPDDFVKEPPGWTLLILAPHQRGNGIVKDGCGAHVILKAALASGAGAAQTWMIAVIVARTTIRLMKDVAACLSRYMQLRLSARVVLSVLLTLIRFHNLKVILEQKLADSSPVSDYLKLVVSLTVDHHTIAELWLHQPKGLLVK